jgi:hypothetical protein
MLMIASSNGRPLQAEMFFKMFGGQPGGGTTRVVFSGGPGEGCLVAQEEWTCGK